MDIFKILQDELQIGYKQVEAAVQLIDEGNTIPFISRYRKEATGSLNDEAATKAARATALPSEIWRRRKNRCFPASEEQGKLTRGVEDSRFWRQRPW